MKRMMNTRFGPGSTLTAISPLWKIGPKTRVVITQEIRLGIEDENMAEATIPVKQEVKDAVDAEKRNGETYNRLLMRLLNELDESRLSENEIREIARDEARKATEDVIREYR